MKVLFPAGIALVAMVACTPQQPSSPPPSPQGTLNQQWLGGGSGPTVAGGSAGNTTTAFDGLIRVYPIAAPAPPVQG